MDIPSGHARPDDLQRRGLHDEYRLPARFTPADIVIDVGAHIGSFAYAVVQRGGEHVCSIEPDAANCALAARHLDPYIRSGRVQLLQQAVWRSDPNDDALRFDGYHPFPRSFTGMEGIVNTGNGSVVFGAGEPVAKVALDDLIDSLTDHGSARCGCSSSIARAPNGRSC